MAYDVDTIYVAGTEINLKHKAFEIYLSGCLDHGCDGCHNPELWQFGVGTPYKYMRKKILDKVKDGKDHGLIESIWILGGEPCHQPLVDMFDLIRDIRSTELVLVLWTHLELDEGSDDSWSRIPFARYFDYVKTGRYKEGGVSYTEPIFGIELANLEQKITAVPSHMKLQL